MPDAPTSKNEWALFEARRWLDAVRSGRVLFKDLSREEQMSVAALMEIEQIEEIARKKRR